MTDAQAPRVLWLPECDFSALWTGHTPREGGAGLTGWGAHRLARMALRPMETGRTRAGGSLHQSRGRRSRPGQGFLGRSRQGWEAGGGLLGGDGHARQGVGEAEGRLRRLRGEPRAPAPIAPSMPGSGLTVARPCNLLRDCLPALAEAQRHHLARVSLKRHLLRCPQLGAEVRGGAAAGREAFSTASATAELGGTILDRPGRGGLSWAGGAWD